MSPILIPKVLQSEYLLYNFGTVTQARLVIDTSYVSGTFKYYMSADNSNYEEVTPNTTHSFTNTGTSLKYRIVGTGTIYATLNGVDKPIKIDSYV